MLVFLEKLRISWWQKWKTVEHAFPIIHTKHLILKSPICTVADFHWHNHESLRRIPHELSRGETARRSGRKWAEGRELAWSFLNFGLLTLHRE